MAELLDDLTEKQLIDARSRVTLVDDGSRDKTWEVICALNAEDKRFEGVKLAHNAGHMNALWAGMRMVCEFCDALVTIDADLQDDVNAIYGFLEKYREGCDVVYGVRKDRSSDTAFKRTTAQGFYKLFLSRSVVDAAVAHGAQPGHGVRKICAREHKLALALRLAELFLFALLLLGNSVFVNLLRPFGHLAQQQHALAADHGITIRDNAFGPLSILLDADGAAL